MENSEKTEQELQKYWQSDEFARDREKAKGSLDNILHPENRNQLT